MKKVFTITLAVVINVSVFTQAPEKMSYQAVVRNSNNSLVTDQSVGMQISILQGTSDGTPVYIETQTPATNTNGLLSVEIGTGIVVSGALESIDWANDTYFIKTEIDPSGGTSYTITGTSQLLSVPYALHAKTADLIEETDPVYSDSEAANITTSDITNLNNLSGINTGDQSLADVSAINNSVNTQLKDVTDPTDAQDAATKAYVDKLELRIGLLEGIYIKDYDGNIYTTVTIGTQIWMAENLKTTHYADGTPLVDGTGAGDITGDYTTKYQFANNDDQNNVATYGRLYTWAAVMNGESSSNANPSGVQGVCPNGWHVPSDDEWKQLELHLGMSQVDVDDINYRGTDEGSKLAGNSDLWRDGVLEFEGSFGSSNFLALPAGYRFSDGSIYSIDAATDFWSSTEFDASNAWRREIRRLNTNIRRLQYFKDFAFSVRCIKD